VHIAHPDGRIIPFDTYNMFYRNGQEKLLSELRGERDAVELTLKGRSPAVK
jgi:uncharacterized radical SAM superfamily Fe-S cluster-containing enzyme